MNLPGITDPIAANLTHAGPSISSGVALRFQRHGLVGISTGGSSTWPGGSARRRPGDHVGGEHRPARATGLRRSRFGPGRFVRLLED